MGSYALTGKQVHSRPVYRHVARPWTVLFDGDRWDIRYRLDPKAPPVAFANSKAHAADAIAPVGSTWHVRSGRNYTLEARVTTHCNPICRMIEITAHSPASERVTGFYVLQTKRFGLHHLFTKSDVKGHKTFLLWSHSRGGWAIAPRAADKDILLFSRDAITDTPSGKWFTPRGSAAEIHASCAGSCRRYTLGGITMGLHHHYMGTYLLATDEVLARPLFIKYGIMVYVSTAHFCCCCFCYALHL